MTIKIDCPACGSGFVANETDLGKQFVCPACSVPIVVQSTMVAPEAPPEPVAQQAQQPTADDGHGVVCPRCQLHFSPSRHVAATTIAKRERKRVLIVEDMGYFREIAQEALAEGYDVETAASVAEAQAVLSRCNVDLIVLDLTLNSQNDGLALLRESMFKPCPVLIFTARDESEMYGEEWEEMQRLGADDILIKGMNVAESLQRKVGALLGVPTEDRH
ncbi:response regulator [bacterium]|nr:response regulator [bacterium]